MGKGEMIKKLILIVLAIETIVGVGYFCFHKEKNVISPVSLDQVSILKPVEVYHLSNGFYCYKEGTNIFYLCLGDRIFVGDDSIFNVINRSDLLWTQYVEIDGETQFLINSEIEKIARERQPDKIENYMVSEEIIKLP